MKLAIGALALSGASALVAPRLSVKTTALNAATLEVSTIAASHRSPLQNRSPRRTAGLTPSGNRCEHTTQRPSERSLAKLAHKQNQRAFCRPDRKPGC
jgi:hypothetical protein